MANRIDTSKSARCRRSPQKPSDVQPNSTVYGVRPEEAAPRTLEEAVENVRTLLIEVRGILHVLSDVLLHSDDEDAVLHAEVAKAAEAWVNEAALSLDLVSLQPLIDALRYTGGMPPDDQSGAGGLGLHQVREPTPIYHA